MNYCINLPRVAHETLDDETIIIDFDTGTYYNLSGTAYWIWFLIEKERSVEEIVNQITDIYVGEQEEIDGAVRQFIGRLVEVELIVKTTAPASTMPALSPRNRAPFISPMLEKHTDIQDLLLLDPIHEVGNQGWPRRKA